MKHRILTMLAAAVCLAVIAGFIPSALSFADVTDPDLSLAVDTLAGLGVVAGNGDGGYQPDGLLTRAQLCKLAVLLEGHGDKVSASGYKTLFADVPATSWAAPYINLAYGEGLIAGYGNGRFGPDDTVTVAQAVTLALHLLGYENSEIGPFWPRDYMAKAADLSLLNGISKNGDAPMTRGEAALLLYGLLEKNTNQGKPFYEGLAAGTVANAVLIDHAEITVYAGGNLTDYAAAHSLPAALVGERGTLLLDKSGRAVGFLPDHNLRRTLTADRVDADTLNGLSVGNGVAVLLEEERTTWQESWYDLRSGDQVVVYYSAAGTMDLLWVKSRGAAAGSTLTGYYEDAAPNTTAPNTVMVLGAVLPVADGGRAAVKGFAIGDKLTVTLNAKGEVVDAEKTVGTAAMVGVLKRVAEDRVEVQLLSNITVFGAKSGTVSSNLVGSLVRLTASEKGKLSVSPLTLSQPSVGLAGLTLAEGVRVFEGVNGSALAEIDAGDLPKDTPASAILHAGKNAAGEVEVLVVNDVTGACFTYGILVKGEKTGGSGSMSYTNATVAVENGTGTGTAYVTGLSFKDGAVGGVAPNGEGKAAAIVTLTAKENLTRADFDGSDFLAGMPLAEDLQVYNTATDKWVALSSARAFTNSFTAYYDSRGIVRVVFAG